MADKVVTIRPAGQGGDYTSMSAAIAGEVALNPSIAVEFSIEGVWTATDATWTLAGFTGPNPCTVINRATGYTVNGGRTATTGFRIQISSYIHGIIAYGNDGPGVQIDSGVNAIADCCIGIARNGGGIYVYGGSIRNCVGITYSPQTYRSGIVGNGIKTNCYAYSPAGNPYASTLNMTTCAGNIAQGSILVAPFDTTTFADITQWAEDLHLVAGSPLIGAGTNLSADPVPLTHDADGVAFGSSYPIGAYAFASGPSSVDVALAALQAPQSVEASASLTITATVDAIQLPQQATSSASLGIDAIIAATQTPQQAQAEASLIVDAAIGAIQPHQGAAAFVDLSALASIQAIQPSQIVEATLNIGDGITARVEAVQPSQQVAATASLEITATVEAIQPAQSSQAAVELSTGAAIAAVQSAQEAQAAADLAISAVIDSIQSAQRLEIIAIASPSTQEPLRAVSILLIGKTSNRVLPRANPVISIGGPR